MSDAAPIIRVVLQRHEADCSVACLAMLLGVSYEDALLAFGAVEPHVLRRGVWHSQIRQAAKILGRKLRTRRRFDLENATGLLGVRSAIWKQEHVVILWDGRIIDTDGAIYDADVYFAVNKAQPLTLLEAD